VAVRATRQEVDERVAVVVGKSEQRRVEAREADVGRHVVQDRVGPHVRVDGQRQGDVLHRLLRPDPLAKSTKRDCLVHRHHFTDGS